MNADRESYAGRIESPCIDKCCLNEEDTCLGCFRSLTEIKQWAVADKATRLQFLKNSIERKNRRKKQGC